MKIALSVVLAAVLSIGTLYADKPEHANKGKKEKQKEHKSKKANKRFSKHEKDAVKAYYKGLPPGLVKKMKRGKGLPPGWKDKVSIGEPMPQEYWQYAKPVSPELTRQLSTGPVGSKVLQIADKIIRVEAGTNMIMDAIQF